MTNYLKDIKINSIDTWGKVFQNIDVFEPIIKEIFKDKGIRFKKVENLTPGSNAVFKVGDYVIKLYVPKEVVELYGDYDKELKAMKIANESGVNTPKVIAYGHYEDNYVLPYVLMEYTHGVEAADNIRQGDISDKQMYVNQLNIILSKFNKSLTKTAIIEHVDEQKLNHRWDMFPQMIQDQVKKAKGSLVKSDHVLVHGDLTGENVLIEDKKLKVIDFGDVKLAPKYYEYGPIVFELFDLDSGLLDLFSRGRENFIEDVFNSIIIHDFGANILRDFCQRHLKIDHTELKDIRVIVDYLEDIL